LNFPIGAAAKNLGIRPDTLLEAANAGRVPFTWGLTQKGQPQRLFSEDTLDQYKRRQRARLLARLAVLDDSKELV